MKTKEEYKKSVEKLRAGYLKDHCPYKIEQRIKIKGHSYTGKDGIIEKIKVDIEYDGTMIYEVCGWVLNANGEIGLNYFRFNEYDETF